MVVDTGVWVDHFRGDDTLAARRLEALVGDADIVVGDLVLYEVLRGGLSEDEVRGVEEAMRSFDVVSMVGPDLAVAAAAVWRKLRAAGVSPRRHIDVLIATYCVESGQTVLHRDRDFDHMAPVIGLKVESCVE